MANNLQGQKVVIIGASSGMGRAVAQLCAEAGASVVMCSRSAEKLDKARQGLQGQLETKSVDMLDETAMNQLFEQIGAFDHLVVTAVADEVALISPIAKLTTENAQRSLDKFWGSFFAVRAAVPYLSKKGSITLTSSVAIYKPSTSGGMSVLSAASAAVAVFGRALAAELAPVRVNVVAPGVTNTGVWENSDPQRLEDTKKWASESLPVRHLGQPEELAQAFLYLMTNTYTTATVLTVDGGLMIT